MHPPQPVEGQAWRAATQAPAVHPETGALAPVVSAPAGLRGGDRRRPVSPLSAPRGWELAGAHCYRIPLPVDLPLFVCPQTLPTMAPGDGTLTGLALARRLITLNDPRDVLNCAGIALGIPLTAVPPGICCSTCKVLCFFLLPMPAKWATVFGKAGKCSARLSANFIAAASAALFGQGSD